MPGPDGAYSIRPVTPAAGGAADEREQAADERDAAADQREQTADEREALADQRERRADEREAGADERERQLDERVRQQRLNLPGTRTPDANLAGRRALGGEDDPREDGPSPHRSVPRTVSPPDVIARQLERRGYASRVLPGGCAVPTGGWWLGSGNLIAVAYFAGMERGGPAS